MKLKRYGIQRAAVLSCLALVSSGVFTAQPIYAVPARTLSIDDIHVLEFDGGAENAVFTVRLSDKSGHEVSVGYSTFGESATAGQDFDAVSGRITFSRKETLGRIFVPISGDTIDEEDETFSVRLFDPDNATILDGEGVATIEDDDLPPTISVGDTSALEGNSGSSAMMEFPVTLSEMSGKYVTVAFSTSDGSAFAGADYLASAGTITLSPGDRTATISADLLGDVIDEPDEAFLVQISGPSNAVIGRSEATGTLIDDDPEPVLAIDDLSVSEGNTGISSAKFTVALSESSALIVGVSFQTVSDSAEAESDYRATAGRLEFLPGETSKSITVEVMGDSLDEFDEAFFVELSSAANATIADGLGAGTILDDDAPSEISVEDVSVVEGDSGTVPVVFIVSLSRPSGKTVTTEFTTVANTANQDTDGSVDYISKSGSLSFLPGEVEKPVEVEVVGDDKGEADEIFYLNIPKTTNATFVGPGKGTILNDDAAVFIRGTGGGNMFSPPNSTTVDEGQRGATAFADFLVVLQGHNDLPVTVQFGTHPCSATDGVSTPCGGGSGSGPDYLTTSATVTFDPGEGDIPGGNSEVVSVPVLGDDEREDSFELFEAVLEAVTGAELVGSCCTWGVIRDDDQDPGPVLAPHLPDECGGAFTVSAFCTMNGHGGGTHIVIIEGSAAPSFVSVSIRFVPPGRFPETVAGCTGFRSCQAFAVVTKPAGDWFCGAFAEEHGAGSFSCFVS